VIIHAYVDNITFYSKLQTSRHSSDHNNCTLRRSIQGSHPSHIQHNTHHLTTRYLSSRLFSCNNTETTTKGETKAVLTRSDKYMPYPPKRSLTYTYSPPIYTKTSRIVIYLYDNYHTTTYIYSLLKTSHYTTPTKTSSPLFQAHIPATSSIISTFSQPTIFHRTSCRVSWTHNAGWICSG